jgi:hypothetical protein
MLVAPFIDKKLDVFAQKKAFICHKNFLHLSEQLAGFI